MKNLHTISSFLFCFLAVWRTPPPQLTARAPENAGLEEDPFLFGNGLFSGAFAVCFRESIFNIKFKEPIQNGRDAGGDFWGELEV